MSLPLTFHVGKGLSSGFLPKIDVKSHRVLLPALLPTWIIQGGKSPFSAPHMLVKTTSVSHFSTLGLLLAKRDQCASTGDAPEYVGLVKERSYPLGLPSAPALVVFLLLLFEQCLLDQDGQRESSVLSFITSVDLKHALQSGPSFINSVLKLFLRRVFIFEHRLLLVKHQECNLGAQQLEEAIAAAYMSNQLSERRHHPRACEFGILSLLHCVLLPVIHVRGSCSGCTPFFLSCSSSLRMLWYAGLFISKAMGREYTTVYSLCCSAP